MKRIAIAILTVVILLSCKTRQIPVFIEKTVTDSIYLVDTLIEVKLEPYVVERYTSDTISHLETKYSSSTAKIDKGVLYHNLKQKDTIVKINTKIEYRAKVIKEPAPYEVEKIVKVEKKLSIWQRLSITVGNIFVILLIFYIFMKVRK